MRIVVRPEALQARTDRQPHLVELMLAAVRRSHDVLIHPDAETHWDAWSSSLTPGLAAVIRGAVQEGNRRQALASNPTTIWVGDPDVSDWEQRPPLLHLVDAVAVSNEALEVFVEDETSDGAFLDAVVPPTHRDAWMKARGEGRVRLRTLGGVTQLARRLTEEPVEPSLRTRRFVLIDSDAPAPWITEGRSREECWTALPDDSRNAAHASRSAGVAVEVLDRRMAENYLPVATLRAWVQQLPASQRKDKAAHVEALATLPPRRRHHHHLKKGLREKDRALYGDLSPDAEQALRFALGDQTWRAFAHAQEIALHDDGVYDVMLPVFAQMMRML
jgi:hypothetical protein